MDFHVADRLAIQNVISSHFLALDSFRLDDWIANYADDAVFIAIDSGYRYESDRADIEEFFRARFSAFKSNADQRRHVVSNVMFVDQSEEAAHVRANGILLTTNHGANPHVVTTLAFEGWFVKHHDAWKIRKWAVRTDTNQNYSKANLPAGGRVSVDLGDQLGHGSREHCAPAGDREQLRLSRFSAG